MTANKDWYIFRGTGKPDGEIKKLVDLAPPPWRSFDGEVTTERALPDDPDQARRRGRTYRVDPDEDRQEEVELVNASLYLRRPLLVTGKPGSGKSSLAYAVAHELKLGPVLEWSITTRSTVERGLYSYDAIGRLQQANLDKDKVTDIGNYIRLGPLATALLPSDRPRVLLIDEFDKGDIDLPNDLLNVFELGRFEIPELMRLPEDHPPVLVRAWDGKDKVRIVGGEVRCRQFPFVVLTSNGERDFPPAFLRRCLRLTIPQPSPEKLARIVESQLAGLPRTPAQDEKTKRLVANFLTRRLEGDLATDQLLNALYLSLSGADVSGDERDILADKLWKYLSGGDAG